MLTPVSSLSPLPRLHPGYAGVLPNHGSSSSPIGLTKSGFVFVAWKVWCSFERASGTRCPVVVYTCQLPDPLTLLRRFLLPLVPFPDSTAGGGAEDFILDQGRRVSGV